MWTPHNNDLQYMRHYQRDLESQVAKQRLRTPPQILAAKNTNETSGKASVFAKAGAFWARLTTAKSPIGWW